MAIFPQGLTNIDRRCDNAGERAVLHQLKRCLSDDYMVWHNVPIGPKARQPDFVILSPRRGLLILEVKHWAWGSMLSFNRDSVVLQLEGGPKTVAHPLSQARGYAMELNNVLEADPALQQEQHAVERRAVGGRGAPALCGHDPIDPGASVDRHRQFPSRATSEELARGGSRSIYSGMTPPKNLAVR